MKLAIVMTKGMSLKQWHDSGSLKREMYIYEQILKFGYFEEIVFFSYSTKPHIEKSLLGKNMAVVTKPRIFFGKIGDWLYSFLFIFINYKLVKYIDIFKSNQILGAWGLVALRLFRTPYVARGGYSLTYFKEKSHVSGLKIQLYRFLENITFKYAAGIIVSSNHDIQRIREEFRGKVSVIKNYVDTNNFSNRIPWALRKKSIVFVGRLEPQKNLISLLKCSSLCNFESIEIVGDGSLVQSLKQMPSPCIKNFHGSLRQNEISDILNESKFFILPSLYEGMPKTLLEAMSAGCLCIGTDVTGIDEILNESKGVISAGTDVNALDRAIAKALSLSDTEIINRIDSAKRFINDNHTIVAYSEKEEKLLKAAINEVR